MRIVAGKYRRRRFDVPKSFKARPTTDMAKENLFNVLSNYLDFEDIAALDLFSGTGGIAFEMVSRGALRVVAVERDRTHCAFISKVKGLLGADELTLLQGDVFQYLHRASGKFDLIFADPPYDLPELESVPSLVLDSGLLAEGGVFVMEHSKANDFSALPCFDSHRHYGAVNFSVFVREAEATAVAEEQEPD